MPLRLHPYLDSVFLDRLTPALVQHWKVSYVRNAGTKPLAKQRAINTCNTLVRNAKALFAKKTLHFIHQRITLPTPLPFTGVTLEKAPSTRYQSKINAGEILQAAQQELTLPQDDESDTPELRWNREQQFKIVLLALLCGLRKSEIDALLWKAVDFENRVLRVEITEFHSLKSHDSAGSVDLDDELVAILRNYFAKSSGDFVIESKNPPRSLDEKRHYRAAIHFSNLSRWLRKKGVTADKPLHELRKEYGALVCHRNGIYAASRALRHSDIRITCQFYVDKKERVSSGLGELLKS